MILDLAEGDRLTLLVSGAGKTYEVIGDAGADPIILRAVEDNVERRISRLDLAVLQGSGKALRTFKKGQVIRTLTATEIKAFHEPPRTDKLTETELKKWDIRKRDIIRAARLLWYVQAWDRNPVSRGEPSLTAFILANHKDAQATGHEGILSASSLRKAIAKGERGHRTLQMYLRRTGGARKKSKFPEWVYELGEEMVVHFYSDPLIRYRDAHGWFDGRFYSLRGAHAENTTPHKMWSGEPPCEQTLTNWINGARCLATLTTKYGLREANRRLRGRGESFEPVAPMETIVLDQTLGPIWAVEKVEMDGTVAIVLKRPWLVWAMDLYTRMVVGLVMTFDPPNIATLMACLRHVICPKTEWLDRFGECKGATDGFGAFKNVILDNALAHIGVTMQFVGDVAGFQVIYAPIHTPEYKPWIERLNATMNGPLRSLPGGIPGSKDEEIAALDARATAALGLDSIHALVAHHIIAYHLDVHAGIGMAPARKWNEGLLEFGRPMVDDARSFRLLLGRYRIGVLTAEGVRVNGHRFHEAGIVSRLMNDFARAGSRRPRKAGQSDSFRIHFIYDEMDTSRISVINELTGEIVELPNYDEHYREKPVSFAFAAGERDYERRQNREFHSREDKARMRLEYEKELALQLANTSHGEGKRLIRVYKGKEKLELGPGGRVLDLASEPTINGMAKAESIPIGMAFIDRVDPLTAPKGRRVKRSSKSSNVGKRGAHITTDATCIETEEAFEMVGAVVDDEALLDEIARIHGY
ncbi:hypothetical protein [Rhizobium sp. BR 315]|uniref:hypothetical protein n=1 Tax=Rhizobium sp. BR 315 TaxID=3040014 RepID=UPI003D34F576